MASHAFREAFSHTHKEIFNWFPGHMTKGMRLMQQKLRSIDGIIELHDARCPLSGRNDLFREKLSLARPHILLLNKKDLADLSRQDEIVRRLKAQGIREVLFTDCLHGQDQTVKQVVPLMVEMIKSEPRYVSPSANASMLTLMIIGVPNVGKSTFINAVRRIFARRGKAAKVGALPGFTRAVQNVITISEKPKMCVIDTPGIAHPKIKMPDDAMKLALCNIMDDSLVGEEHIVDYLLFWLNKRKDFRYVESLGLTEPVDDVKVLLIKYAVKHDLFLSMINVEGGSHLQRPDTQMAAKRILRWFRKGEMGTVMLDDDKLDLRFRGR